MAFIRKTFKLEKDAEVTIEANPGTLRHQKLTGYKSAGINRISIGLQSADDEELPTALSKAEVVDIEIETAIKI